MKIPYQKNYLNRLKNYLKIKILGIIPRTIDDDELLVRGIVSPLFVKKKKLTHNAFLPPPGKTEVSLLRHSYTSDDFCKQHAQSLNIKNQTYTGLATFLNQHIAIITDKNNFSVKAKILASPLNKRFELIKSKLLHKMHPGLPMHADLVYSEPLQKGVVATEHRLFADEILRVSNYFPDPEPSVITKYWRGKSLCWEPNSEGSCEAKVQS
ncbi:MAG: hypothetical protein E6Q96_00070 [Cyclobacteriaceae bacterium]|nr:MAG: hypothetical protein E6Q96_00070 [Cyclobacteriaceae bacterium]